MSYVLRITTADGKVTDKPFKDREPADRKAAEVNNAPDTATAFVFVAAK